MLSFMRATVASTLFVLIAAAPTIRKRSAFTVHQTPNPGYVKNGTAAYAKARAKFAAPGTVVAIPSGTDSEYLCPVIVGDQTFSVLFDTGSSEFWVYGDETGVSGHTIYVPGSTARKMRGSTWYISYGDGSEARGIVYKDTVNIGGVHVINQAVQVATAVTNSDSESESDGILGLAFGVLNSIRPTQQRTWFDSAVAQGLPAIFAADLYANAPGAFDFGAINALYSDSDITYIDIDNSRGVWTFTPDYVTIGSGPSYTVSAGIVDTGTSLLLLDDVVVEAYYDQISSATYDSDEGGWVFECSADLPDFTVTVNGYDAVVPGSYINYSPADTVGRNCYGGIQAHKPNGVALYGVTFLKSQYVIFDQTTGSPRLGLTEKME